jgi:hypothetical protein
MPTKFKAATQPAVALALFVDPVKVSILCYFFWNYLNALRPVQGKSSNEAAYTGRQGTKGKADQAPHFGLI